MPRRLMLAGLPLLLALAACGGVPWPGTVASASPSPGAAASASPLPSPSPTPQESAGLEFDRLEAPESGTAGQPVTISGEAVLPDGCWGTPEMTLELDPVSRVVTVTGTRKRVRDICPQVLGFAPVSATFTPPEPGAYRVEGTVYGYQTGDGQPKPFRATVQVR